MDITVLACILSVCYILIRIFNLCSECQVPLLRHSFSSFTNTFIELCPILTEVYQPPQFWGKNGHFQTFVYGLKGRFRCQPPHNRQRTIARTADGATVSFDIFEPTVTNPEGVDTTICIAPGIGNNSESQYVRSAVNLLGKHGYRVAVLNHLGTLSDVELTAPRIYSYGGTEEYHLMIEHVVRTYPSSFLLAVGISMGGNVVTKYLGECKKHEKQFLGGLSICQGYDVVRCERLFSEWDYGFVLRRLYYWIMTRGVQKTLRNHEDYLFHSRDSRERLGDLHFDVGKIFTVTTLHELDEEYSRKVFGFNSLQDYYVWASSARYMNNIDIPMVFLNSLDDPVVPPELQDIPLDYVLKSPNALSVVTQFGGHLGFYEGSYFAPRSLTFMDRFLLQFCNALLTMNAKGTVEWTTRRSRPSLLASTLEEEEEEIQESREIAKGHEVVLKQPISSGIGAASF